MEEKILNKFTIKTDELCPVRDVLARLGDKWSLLILATLKMNGTLRFSDIQRTIGEISQRMLTVTLRSLEADGIVSREIYPQIPPRVEYALTELGDQLFTHMQPLLIWAEENKTRIQSNRDRFKQ